MTNRDSAIELLNKIEFLFEKYSTEMRATTQPYNLSKVFDYIKDYVYDPEDNLVRESLMEHVGSLPIIATAFYPYINDNEVEIGKSLLMLSIHDIGELITGDEITFTKDPNHKDKEQESAMALLDISYHDIYKDMESQTSKSAKFAKSIDKITPDIIDYLTPAYITAIRYRHYVGIEPNEIPELIIKHKRPYMLWSPFMTEFHKLLLEKISEKITK